jgi:hypothetical protein
MVAAVRHLHVGGWASLGAAERGQHPLATGNFGLDLFAQQLADDITDAVPLSRRHHVIDAAGNGVPVVAQGRHAAGRDDELAVLPLLEQFRNGRNRLVTRRTQEPAGVDDDDARIIRAVDRGHALGAQEVLHTVRVHPVLRAAKGEDVKAAIVVLGLAAYANR